MKKPFCKSLLALGFLCTVFAARAYTVEEILADGPYMISNLKHSADYWYYININVERYYGIKLEKVDDSHIKFCNFEANYDFVFTLTDNSGRETTDGTQLRIDGFTPNVNQAETDNKENYLYNINSMNPSYGAYYWNRNNSVVLSITKKNGKIYISGYNPNKYGADNNAGYLLLEFLSSTNAPTPIDCSAVIYDSNYAPFSYYESLYPDFLIGSAKDRYDTFKYSSGARASETAPANTRRVNSRDREYPVLVRMNRTSKTFEFINLANLGFGYDGAKVMHPKATYKDDGTLTLDILYLHYRRYEEPGYWQSTAGFDSFYFTTFDPASNNTGSQNSKVAGTWESQGPRHILDETNWVDNGGVLRTIEAVNIRLDNYTLRTPYEHSGKITFDGGYFDTDINFGSVCTNDVDLSIDAFQWHPVDGLAAQLTVTTKENDHYVDHYDIMVAKGEWNSIHDNGFVYDAETGIKDAILFSGRPWTKGNATAKSQLKTMAVDNSKDRTEGFWLDSPTLGSQLAEDGKYTFFVRTVYTEDSGLEPTFHSMTHVEDPGMTTGITSVSADDTSASDKAEYFNTRGQAIDTPVTPGIYFKRTGTTTEKIIVR